MSYGSNLHRARFQSYLEGGRMPGGRRADAGCRDPSPPQADEPVFLPYPLYFSGESRVWGGGVAFLDHLPGEHDMTYARMYLITGEQFEDLVAQESKRLHATVDWTGLVREGRTSAGTGRYDELVVVGDRDGVPMVTFTHPVPMADVHLARPEAGYLRVLAEGLRDCHHLTDPDIADYLLTCPGAAGTWTKPALLEALAAVDDDG